jgi:DnaK suppressor protein
LTKKPAPKTASKKPIAKKATRAAKKTAPAPTKIKQAAKAKKPIQVAKKVAKANKPMPVAKKVAKPSHKLSPKSPKLKLSTKLKSSTKGTPQSKVKATLSKPVVSTPKTGLKPAPKAATHIAAASKPASHKAGEHVTKSPDKALPAVPTAPPPAKRLSSRAAARANSAPAQAPLPLPTSRFADRFAPPRPPTRQMAKVELDTPRHVHVFDPKLANAWKTKAGRDMTEAEVLAMPESEYMNDKQLEFFRRTLQALKDSLLSNAGETTEHLREDTSIVPDPADRATIEEEHALELRTRDRERKLLKKISQSLTRIEAGEYGFCDETGEPIGLGRLIARPTATLSLEAQQRRELKQKMFGD